MSRILLADDSPHAQRMGERILREEGYEVVTVTDGQAALLRMQDVDPDVVFADISLPRRSGYEICRAVKENPKHRHVRVVLTAGLLEPFDEAQASEVKSDGVLKKPFESSVVLATIKPLVEAARKDRQEITQPASAPRTPPPLPAPVAATPESVPAVRETVPEVGNMRPLMQRLRLPGAPPISKAAPVQAVPVRVMPEAAQAETAPPNGASQAETERVRAAVTVALDAAMPALIDELTKKVLIALGH